MKKKNTFHQQAHKNPRPWLTLSEVHVDSITDYIGESLLAVIKEVLDTLQCMRWFSKKKKKKKKKCKEKEKRKKRKKKEKRKLKKKETNQIRDLR